MLLIKLKANVWRSQWKSYDSNNINKDNNDTDDNDDICIFVTSIIIMLL